MGSLPAPHWINYHFGSMLKVRAELERVIERVTAARAMMLENRIADDFEKEWDALMSEEGPTNLHAKKHLKQVISRIAETKGICRFLFLPRVHQGVSQGRIHQH